MRGSGIAGAKQAVRILGIDPGYAIVGYGVVDYDGYRFQPVEYGCIRTDAGTPFERRLAIIWDELDALIAKCRPETVAIERLYFQNNQKTAIDVAQARGVTVLCAVKRGVEMFEYTPLQVKQAVAGYGKADKRQVQLMTKTLLGLTGIPKPDDAADALAIAICHGHSAGVGTGLKKLMDMR